MEFLKKTYKFIFIFCFSLFSSLVYTQEFEGIATYEILPLNPNKLLISDQDFFASLPASSRKEMKFYLKKNQYKAEYEDHVEIYMPEKNQIAIFNTTFDDSIYFQPASIVEEKMNSLKSSVNSELVYEKSCSSLILTTDWGTITYYYNKDLLPTERSYWKRHIYNYLAAIINKTGSFPVKIITDNMLNHSQMTLKKLEPKKLDSKTFDLPKKYSP